MKKLELIDYEPASDVGHFRFYPKGMIIKTALEEFANNFAIKELKAMRIETPMIYKLDEPDIAEQASRFKEKDYRLKVDNKEFILRFAGDFGLFRMMKDAIMSYKQLPIRVYELSPSFRLEQSGECVGLKRLRAFTMPDIHCFCKNLEEGLLEYKLLFEKYTEFTNSMEIEYAIAFRVVKEFYLKNKEWIVSLLKIANKPALIEILPEMKHYWILKHEYQAIDSTGGNIQLATLQLDVEDAARYGIYYVDENGEKKGCIILHSSMGSIERWIGVILEQAAKDMENNKVPKLPLWLSPIQVRIIPVNMNYLDKAIEIALKINENNIRADVDDRNESVAKKIRDAETEWIPYIVVLGEKEVSTGELSVRIRGEGIVSKKLEELIEEINKKISSKPRVPLCLPIRLSARPSFK
jgi:threonyl-tRNA synthetase